ncbi:VOC family protein [Ramlibacter sp. AN1015]|uniref:VOC family protein n=1 Tax=Ramlibacter sp. AN1015 TaxID=3133428 RepID=UPI0030C333F6
MTQEIRICLDVDDIERAIAFYTQGFGLRLGRRLQDDWAELLGASAPIDLLVEPAGSAATQVGPARQRSYERHWTPVHLDFVVADLDARVAALVALGARLERPIQQRRWGRMANLSDPFGHGFDLLEMQGRGYDEIIAGGK